MFNYFIFALLVYAPTLFGEKAPPLPPELENQLSQNPEGAVGETGFGMDRFFGEALQMLLALGIIIGILLIASWFVRKMLNTKLQQMNSGSLIKINERRVISAKSSLYLIEVEEHTILIGESHAGLTLLGNFPTGDKQAKKSFETIMREKENNDRYSP